MNDTQKTFSQIIDESDDLPILKALLSNESFPPRPKNFIPSGRPKDSPAEFDFALLRHRDKK